MLRKWLLTIAAVSLTLPVAVASQETPAPRPRRENRGVVIDLNRGRIGVVVNTAADSATDRYGARIEAVTPGGPAEKAGLKAGDIITRFNGTSLGGLVPVNNDDSGPGLKLVDLAHDLEPGDTVKLAYRRGSATRTATLVAKDLGGYVWASPLVRPPSVEVRPRVQIGDISPLMRSGFSFCFGDAWCSLELVTLNEGLGEYFGTKEGILVVKAPADSTLPLRSGDVILAIGDRKPTSPSHAMRILRSYVAGETVTIEVMRHQHRMTVSWKVPEAGERGGVRTPFRRESGERTLWDGEAMQRALEESRRAMEQSRKNMELLLQHNRDAFQRQDLRALQDRLRVLKRSATVSL